MRTLLALVALLALAAPADAATDRQIARASLLTLGDLPSGWKVPRNPERQRIDCAATADARRRASGVANSPPFTQGDNTQASTAVYVYSDAASARRAYRAISGARLRRCYAREVAKALRAAGVRVRNTRNARLRIAATGDQSSAARVTVAVTAEGVDAKLYLDLVFVRTGRGLSLAQLTSAGTPFNAALRDRLVATQADRLADRLR